jgi:hypothetical protein
MTDQELLAYEREHPATLTLVKAKGMQLLVPYPENIYRWRVQYDCGCIEEQLATKRHPPVRHRLSVGRNAFCGIHADQDVFCMRNAPRSTLRFAHVDHMHQRSVGIDLSVV